MYIITTIIRLLILVVCTVGFIFSAKLYLKLDKSVYKTMAILFMYGFVAIVIGKVIAVLGLYIDALEHLGMMHEAIGAVGTTLLLVGLVSVLVNSIVATDKLDKQYLKRFLDGTD